jgi:hypothetical protein
MNYIVSESFIKDSFRTTFMPNDVIATGNYSADFTLWNWKDDAVTKHRAISPKMTRAPPEPGKDFGKRVTCAEAHPTAPILACPNDSRALIE